jgi:hypothetical protein
MDIQELKVLQGLPVKDVEALLDLLEVLHNGLMFYLVVVLEVFNMVL